ncbi:MAG TPA: Rieske (2Fe-2S) protein [Micromonosporaceae bacterium]|nr:Rieske (2Fe-2S) protein [Micromonosporaceae bacterium]
MSETTRRAVLAGAAGMGAAAALAACGGSDADTTSDANAGANPAPSTPAAAAPTSAAAGGAAGAIKTADIPVNGGKIFTAQKVVITQPVAGTFKAFDVACPHKGCPVSQVAEGAIVCVCHNSKFSATDGSVMSGPSAKGLTPATVTVNGDSLTLS